MKERSIVLLWSEIQSAQKTLASAARPIGKTLFRWIVHRSSLGNLNTETPWKIGFRRRRQPLNLRPACIAQLIQVELLRRRQSLVQIQGASLSYSQFFNVFRYTKIINPVAIKTKEKNYFTLMDCLESKSEFNTTESELKAIAIPAIRGLSRPIAAKGIQIELYPKAKKRF